MAFLDHIRACNRWDPAAFVPFRVDGRRVGLLQRALASELGAWPAVFRTGAEGVDWVHPAQGLPARTEVLAGVLAELVERGLISHLHGERYPVTSGSRFEACMLIDRASAPAFGVRAHGQHVNGFVRDGDDLELWIGRRARDRRVAPGRLDNLVGGGLPWGLSLTENLRKECMEEAGIPPGLADRAVGVGAVTYCREGDGGLKPDVMYCYDLELPADFVPRCTDGEVETFYRMPVEEVRELIRETDQFKLNCNLVILDFLVRHGYLSQDSPDYLEIVQGLRSPLP